MNESKWAIRKIRKGGRIKVGGKWYVPDKRFMKYDGRLDGLTYVFGRYLNYEPHRYTGKYMPLLDMHGTLEMWKAGKDPNRIEEFKRLFHNDPQIMEDGVMPWGWWHEEEKVNNAGN